MPAEDHRTQYIALTLIVLGAVCIIIGSKFEWRDLINYAMTFGGGGVGILTGQKLQQMSTNKINNNPTTPPAN